MFSSVYYSPNKIIKFSTENFSNGCIMEKVRISLRSALLIDKMESVASFK